MGRKKIYPSVPVEEPEWKKKLGKGRREREQEKEKKNTWGSIVIKRHLSDGPQPEVRSEWRKERFKKIMKNDIEILTDEGGRVALTEFQHAFVLAYVQHGNATKAAKAAGSKAEGASLRSVGSKTLQIPGVKEAIQQVEREVIIDSAVSSEEIVMNMKKIIKHTGS